MNILLYAFIENNLGDDLFIKLLCERYPNVNFYLPISFEKANYSLKKLNNLHFSQELNLIYQKLKKESILNNHLKLNFSFLSRKEKQLLKSFDASVYIVGSAFIQRSKNKDYSNLILLDKMVNLSKNFFLINTNFGPFVDDRYLQKSKKILSKMNDVCFRDEYSFNLFKELNNVRKASDIVLSINEETDKNNTVLISVMDLSKEYINFINNCVNQIKDKGYLVKLVTFCKNQNDEAAANKIFNSETIKYDGNIEEILNEFKSCNSVIATRFHSMILAFSYNKNVLPIIYSQKTLKVIKDANFSGDYIELDKINSYNIEGIIDNLFSKQTTISPEYKKDALNQFKALDKFVGKQNEI